MLQLQLQLQQQQTVSQTNLPTTQQPKRRRARAVCKQLQEPDMQKACRLIANRLKKQDQKHDWICVGVLKGTDTQVFTQLKDFAKSGSHKFITFDQDETTFGILGVRKQDTAQEQSPSEAGKKNDHQSPPSPPKLRLKVVDHESTHF